MNQITLERSIERLPKVDDLHRRKSYQFGDATSGGKQSLLDYVRFDWTKIDNVFDKFMSENIDMTVSLIDKDKLAQRYQ